MHVLISEERLHSTCTYVHTYIVVTFLQCMYVYVCVRIQIRIMFEVEDLRYATLATVSRCGMVWFSEDVLSMDIIFDHFLNRLRNTSIDADGDEDRMSRLGRPTVATAKIDDAAISPSMQV